MPLPTSKLSKSPHSQRGFTLMEVLVSTSIFVLATLAVLSIYSTTLKAGQKTTALTRVQKEAQLIMEVLAKKIRTSRVDYSYTGYPISNPEDELALTDLVDDDYVFKQSGNYIVVSVNGGDDKIIPASNVYITDLKFYINPETDPFLLIQQFEEGLIDYLPQPYVTVVMTVSSTQAAQAASLVVQQTVPQRSGLVE